MTQITLSSGQVQQLDAGSTLVECRDPSGKLVGYLHVAGRNDPNQIPDFSAEQLADSSESQEDAPSRHSG